MNPNLRAVEHLQAKDVEVLRRARADDLCKARDTNPRQLTAGTLLRLLFSKLVVFDSLHCELQSGRVVTAVVLPSQRRLIRELFRLDEILEPKLGGIHSDLVRHHIRDSLDGVHGFGDAEGAAVGDSTGRLIGVSAVHFNVGRFQVIGTGADVKQTGRKLRGIRGRIGVAVIGYRFDSQTGDRAVLFPRKLGAYVIVASKGIGLEIFHSIFDPLDGFAREH